MGQVEEILRFCRSPPRGKYALCDILELEDQKVRGTRVGSYYYNKSFPFWL